MDTQINKAESKVDEIEKLLKEIEKEPTESQIEKLTNKIKELEGTSATLEEKMKKIGSKEKKNRTEDEEKQLTESKEKLKGLYADISRLKKTMEKISKDATEAQKLGLKPLGENLDEIKKTIDEMITESSSRVENSEVGTDDFENEVNGPLKAISKAETLHKAGRLLGTYLKKVVGNIEEASGISGLMSEAFSKVFGNKGKSGFKRLTSLFLKGKTGTPSYLSALDLSMAKAAGSREDGLLGNRTLFQLALKHVWLLYLKECLEGFDKEKITVGDNRGLKTADLQEACKFWTTNYKGKELKVLKKDYWNWKSKMETNIGKDLKEDGPNKTEIKNIKNTLLDVKDLVDRRLVSGINSAVKGEIK